MPHPVPQKCPLSIREKSQWTSSDKFNISFKAFSAKKDLALRKIESF